MSARLGELSERLKQAARPLGVLAHLEWPGALEDEFLEGYRRGAARPPRVELAPVDVAEPRAQLEALLADLDDAEPAEQLLGRAVRSYLQAAELIESRGTRRFQEVAVEVYGSPARRIPGTQIDSAAAAKHFLAQAAEFPGVGGLPPDAFCLSAASVRDYLLGRQGEVLTEHPVRVELDPDLGAKAAAGAQRVRLRDRTCFSGYDPEQLLQHEVYVHALTALNGRLQPVLGFLGEGAPHTTATQEGLASFAELVTGAMDMGRLRRLALRVVALEAGLAGADFLEVFEVFREGGQSEAESYHSTRRIFRGGLPEGGAVFPKDGVYLEGILRVSAFFHWAFREERLDLARLLFSGRMDLEDVFALDAPGLKELVQPPRYLPPWMSRVEALASTLAFSDFAARVGLAQHGCPAAPG